MKLQILHGPAINSSRQKLLQIRKAFDLDNVVVFEKGADARDILDNLVSTSLFSNERLVILENPPESFSFDSFDSSVTLVLWFDHEIDPQKWPGAEMLFFPEAKEVSVFPFLDYLGQRDKRAFLELDKLKKGGFDHQYLITMIFYLLRSLIYTPQKAATFVKNKNAKMRPNFSKEELKNLYKFVLDVDFKIKSGLLEPLQAEFLLVNKFL